MSSGTALWLDGARAPLLEARALSKGFDLPRSPLAGRRGRVRALEGLWLAVEPGETLALVGESGSGKSTAVRALLRLLEPDAGQVWWRRRDGSRVDLLALDGGALRALRPELGIVFQDPLSSLNPRLRVERALSEPLSVHRRARDAALGPRVRALLEQVGLSGEVEERFPHELSGGQRQRVAIARALALEPRLLVCDEVASALDVSLTAQVLDLLDRLQRELALSLLFVSHDLGVVRHVADRVLFLYLGRPVEVGPAEALLAAPAHPYARLLVESAPALEAGPARPAPPRGEPPSALSPPPGCAFHPRCPRAEARCAREEPQPLRLGAGHVAACHALER